MDSPNGSRVDEPSKKECFMRSDAFRALSGLLAALVLPLAAGPPAAASEDPSRLLEALRASRLELGRAVALQGVELDTGLARFVIESGTVIPTAAVGRGALEVAFVGRARLVLEPPDEIEAGQLELFTGSRSLDEVVTEAVFVIGNDAAASALLSRPAAAPNEALSAQAVEIFSAFRESPERRALGVEMALLLDALGEPAYDTYFAGWFHGEELGKLLYVVEPGTPEQVTLGSFEELELDEKERRKAERDIAKQQRQGRLVGLRLADLGWWDTWLSASRTGPDGRPQPETASFEPERYVLEVDLEGDELELAGRARVELRAVDGRSRAVSLRLDPDLQVETVRDDSGRPLFFLQDRSFVLVLLPEAPAPGDTLMVDLAYGGRILERLDSRNFVLRNTEYWHPRTGTVDRARYDVTLRRPRMFDLVAAGRRVDGGEEPGGVWWERRVVDRPTIAYSFEAGRYATGISGRAGDVAVKLWMDAASAPLLGSSREELLDAVIDSLLYFEELFGPYPLDELTVVTTPRWFSQSLLGFVTLSTPQMADWDEWDYRAVVAHEVAHQWWGHQVGWKGYRDAWISEAIANYSALLYTRNKLELNENAGPTASWRDHLFRTVADGRPVESVGPIVLGGRLSSTRAPGAYEPIVYLKGTVVLDMLARTFREENFVKVLRKIVEVAELRRISTEDFLAIVAQATGHDLDAFAQQFLYGTGQMDVYYRYDIEPTDEGRWLVTGEAWQEPPYRYRYRVATGTGGTLDVERETVGKPALLGAPLVVPVAIAVHDPAKEDGKARRGRGKASGAPAASNAMLGGHMMLSGERTQIRFEVSLRPTEIWLDRDRALFLRFYDERREPKRVLFFQGLDHGAAGRLVEAAETYRRALAAPLSTETGLYSREGRLLHAEEERILDRQIHVGLARVSLAAGREAEAREHLARADELGRKSDPLWLRDETRVLQARISLRRDDPRGAYELLRKKRLQNRTWYHEGLAALAIAAKAVGDEKEYQAVVDALEGSDVDLSRLNGGA
jgi:hypothetical protein